VIIVFVDGVGLGDEGISNPFYAVKTPGLSEILEGRSFTAPTIGFSSHKATLSSLDACLGIPGYPQSATGQASIFTGVNAAEFLGQHLNGFPNKKLRELLAAKGIFSHLKKMGYSVCFANAYRPLFFELLAEGLPGDRYSCSTLITFYGGVKFFGIAELITGQALYMDITNSMLRNMDYDLPLITPEQGAEILFNISREYDFCLFEYFLSDLAGHFGEYEQINNVIETLDRFIGALADRINLSETLLILCSDHGNLEDSSVNEHTLNRVPLLVLGEYKLRQKIVLQSRDLTDLVASVELGLAWKGDD
jgi:2,3-bisphosphoglycerate-independent phosphoglycerate mutase